MQDETIKIKNSRIPATRISTTLSNKIHEVLDMMRIAGLPMKLSVFVNNALQSYAELILSEGIDYHVSPKISQKKGFNVMIHLIHSPIKWIKGRVRVCSPSLFS